MENTLFLRRAECGRISQRRLAQLAGLAFDRCFRIEKGYVDPTPEERAVLARVLETTEEALFPELASTSADGSAS